MSCRALLGGLVGGMTDHQGHPRGVAPQVDRCQIGVRHTEANVGEIDTQHLGDHGCQDRVGALPDLGFAAEDGDTSRAVELELDARLRQVVPVDGEAGPTQIGATGQTQTATVGELAVALAPAAPGDHGFDTASQADGPQLQPVGSDAPGLGQVSQTQIGRVDAELPGRLVEMDLEANRGWGVPCPRLGPQGGLLVKQRTPSKR